MPYQNYQYYDNANNLWQVTLPADFGAALGLPIALGSEPYLDPTISPRFVSYRSTNPAIQRQAVISTTTQFGNPPFLLTVGGVQYQFLSAQGETIPALPFNLIQAVQGPQGATGATGPQGPAGTIGSVANNTLVGNISGGTATPVGLTATQATTLINPVTSSLKGVAPASGGGTTNFLRADATWAAPPSGGSPTVGTYTSLTSYTAYSFTHGLGRLPYSITVLLKCVTANSGFAVGDVIYGLSSPCYDNGLNAYDNFQTSSDATTITLLFGDALLLFPKGGGAGVRATTADFNATVSWT